MSYQMYLIHLLDGSIIKIAEDYDLPMKKGLISKYQNAAPNEILVFGNAIDGFTYVPKSSILYISTGDVEVR